MELPVSAVSHCVTGMDPLFQDNEKEVREILERGREAIMDGEDDGESAIPREMCLRLCPTLDYKLMSGFPIDVLQKIIERAIPFISSGGKGQLKRNECVLLTLVWFRTGANVKLIVSRAGVKYQVCLRAIQKGLKGLAACFEPFKIYGQAPKLKELLSEADKAIIPKRAQESVFIVDGKHIPGKRIGTFEDAMQYWSFKLNTLAYQFQCVVTHLGHCVYVSEPEKAATHDMMVYRNNRTRLLAGLLVEGYNNPIILADQGYKCELPELYVSDTPCRQLNARRLVVENYFGGMANVFRIVRVRFPFTFEYVSPYLKALCFLTNVSVYMSPLREDDFKLHRVLYTFWRTDGENFLSILIIYFLKNFIKILK